MKWQIDRIYVLKPINFTNIRRNEVKSKIPARNISAVMNGGQGPLCISTAKDIQQRAALVLKNVHYIIEAHFEMTDQAAPGDSPGKFSDLIRRRLEKGQCYHQPCFGCREFPAHFRKWPGGAIPTAYPEEEKDLGFMFYDFDYSDKENMLPQFFRATLKGGILDLRDCEVFL